MVVALASGLLPGDWTQGFWWGALVMLSVPAHGLNVVGTRLLVVGEEYAGQPAAERGRP